MNVCSLSGYIVGGLHGTDGLFIGFPAKKQALCD